MKPAATPRRKSKQSIRGCNSSTLRPFLADKETSEVFILAVDGLIQDLPNPKVLRKRLEVLVDRFTEG